MYEISSPTHPRWSLPLSLGVDKSIIGNYEHVQLRLCINILRNRLQRYNFFLKKAYLYGKNAYIGHILSFASIYIAPYFLLHYIVIVHPTTSKIMKTTLLASIYSFLCGSGQEFQNNGYYITESTLKSQDMSRTKAQPLPSLVGEGQGWGL